MTPAGPPPTETPTLPSRFTPLGVLGVGAMGTVFKVHDSELDGVVALKTLKGKTPADLLELKREFRSLADLRHVNLVRYYDLFIDEAHQFFTMEVIDGDDFITFLSGVGPPGTAARLDRIPALALSLARGVHALHGAGLLHRDLKPSNVLVTRNGRPVILDFGLAVRTTLAGAGGGSGIAGTREYIAPEQIWGKNRQESDWYSVGVMLHEALTGSRPEPPWLGALAPRKASTTLTSIAAPKELVELIGRLLARDPAHRPRGEDVIARLEAALASNATPEATGRGSRPPATEAFFGREVELAALDAALAHSRQEPVTVHVFGPSGIGKTSMLSRAVAAFERAGALVLAGRCYAQELIPYRALDELVDALAGHLERAATAQVEALRPRYLLDMVRLFPVLDEVEWGSSDAESHASSDAHEQRRRGFVALRDVLAGLAETRPLVLWIDDIQWGDVDGAVFLHQLASSSRSPKALVVLSYREDDIPLSSALGALRSEPPDGVRLRWLPVEPLSAGAIRSLVQALPQIAEEDAQEIVDQSKGSPLLARELAIHMSSRRDAREEAGGATLLASVVRERLDGMTRGTRRVLEVLAVAARPIEARLIRAADSFSSDPVADLDRLPRDAFLRRAGDGDEWVIYHQQIADIVATQLSTERAVEVHLGLARALEAAERSLPHELAIHFHGGGELALASKYALRAGDEASRTLAFAQAAELYGMARAWASEREVRDAAEVKEAEALANAGRLAGAGDRFLSASARAAGDAALELKRRAAEMLMSSGRMDEGAAVIRPVLEGLELGWPKSGLRAMLLTLPMMGRLWLRTRAIVPGRGGQASMPARTRMQIETCWSLGRSLMMVDFPRGTYFVFRSLLLALETNDSARIGRALAIIASGVLSPLGGAFARWASDLLDRASRLAESSGDDYLRGLSALSRAQASLFNGRWAETVSDCEAGVELLTRRCRGVLHECNLGRMGAMRALEELGKVPELIAEAESMYRLSTEQGDVYGQVTASLYRSFGFIASDEPSEARRWTQRALDRWTSSTYHMQHLYGLRIFALADLYEGDPRAALAKVDAAWPNIERAGFLRIPMIRADAYLLRARALAAAASLTGDGGLRDRTSRDLNVLSKQARPDLPAHAAFIGAGLARGEERERRLANAAEAFSALGMQVFEGLARAELATARGDDRARHAALDAVRAAGVDVPEKFLMLTGWPALGTAS